MRKMLVVAVLLFHLLACNRRDSVTSSSKSPKPTQANRWDAKKIDVAAFFVANDFNALVDGNDSFLKKADLPYVAHVDIVTTAKEYEADFDANEIAADRKYGGKKILLYGKVASIDKDAMGHGYLSLISSSNFRTVQAHLEDESVERAATIAKGDSVTLVCVPGTRIVGFATLHNCLFLSKYLDIGHIKPEDQVRDFFSGKTPLHFNEFAEALVGYAFASSAMIPRACFSNPTVDTCDSKKWRADKSSALENKNFIEQAMSPLTAQGKHLFKLVSCRDPSHETAGSNPNSPDTCVLTRVASE